MMIKEWLAQAVMSMFNKANTDVKTNYGMSEKFEVKFGVH